VLYWLDLEIITKVDETTTLVFFGVSFLHKLMCPTKQS